jgi:hypothetical protein
LPRHRVAKGGELDLMAHGSFPNAGELAFEHSGRLFHNDDQIIG